MSEDNVRPIWGLAGTHGRIFWLFNAFNTPCLGTLLLMTVVRGLELQLLSMSAETRGLLVHALSVT